MNEDSEDVELEAEIPYPLFYPTQFGLEELISDSALGERVSVEQIGSFGRMLKAHSKVFSTDSGVTPLIEMDIERLSDDPVRSKPYRMSPRQTEILRGENKRLLELGIIEKGSRIMRLP